MTQIKTWPIEGMAFPLTLDLRTFHPRELPERFGYPNPEAWQYVRREKGSRKSTPRTRMFRMVRVSGRDVSFSAVRKILHARGRNPKGEWLEAFRMTYPTHGYHDPVGVADSSWINPEGHATFPCYVDTRPYLLPLTLTGKEWLWLIEVVTRTSRLKS